MASTGTRRVIEHYIESGGAKMDEDSYQKYKIAILTKWLDKYFTLVGFRLKCNLCKSIFEYNDVDGQLAI